MITLIVAKSKNNVIGRGNDLPWHLPSDLKHFKETTRGKPVIMGRLTWESLPFKPLPGRRNIVITSNPDPVNVSESFSSLSEALEVVRDEDEAFIIGGEQLYRSAILEADRLIVSELDIEIEGDRFFPEIDQEVWTATSIRCMDGDSIPYQIIIYERR